jgi:hypothetical protein
MELPAVTDTPERAAPVESVTMPATPVIAGALVPLPVLHATAASNMATTTAVLF